MTGIGTPTSQSNMPLPIKPSAFVMVRKRNDYFRSRFRAAEDEYCLLRRYSCFTLTSSLGAHAWPGEKKTSRLRS